MRYHLLASKLAAELVFSRGEVGCYWENAA